MVNASFESNDENFSRNDNFKSLPRLDLSAPTSLLSRGASGTGTGLVLRKENFIEI